jgi:hypothetical protein
MTLPICTVPVIFASTSSLRLHSLWSTDHASGSGVVVDAAVVVGAAVVEAAGAAVVRGADSVTGGPASSPLQDMSTSTPATISRRTIAASVVVTLTACPGIEHPDAGVTCHFIVDTGVPMNLAPGAVGRGGRNREEPG